jgi:hypothetical protein
MKKTALIMIVALTISVFANAQTRVQIKSADLPKAITENLAKDFNGYAVQNAFKVTVKDKSTYELIVAKGTEKEKLEYSAAGAFIKKAPVVAAAHKATTAKPAAAKPAAKPAAKTEPTKK